METLTLRLETQGRSGKKVTLVNGFTRRSEELEEFAARIKKTCGTGGTVRGMSLEIQGDAREKIRYLLTQWGFRVLGH
jgi:translation initiation factor 1